MKGTLTHIYKTMHTVNDFVFSMRQRDAISIKTITLLLMFTAKARLNFEIKTIFESTSISHSFGKLLYSGVHITLKLVGNNFFPEVISGNIFRPKSKLLKIRNDNVTNNNSIN